MRSRATRHELGVAHLIHRVSGVALVLFLPVHFWLLALAMTDREMLASGLALTHHPLVKIAEWVLVFFLSVHALGGIRLLVLEWVPAVSERWTQTHMRLASIAFTLAILISGVFYFGAVGVL